MILVVDDDPKALLAVESIFGRNEQVVFARDSSQALELMGLVGADVTAALIDLDLPKIDGFELIRQLHRRYPRLTLVAISGVFQDDVLQSATATGAAIALRKPVSGEWRTAVDHARTQAAGR